jgi:hypothetical protein
LTIINPVIGIINTSTDGRGFFVVLALPPGHYVFLGSHIGTDYFFSPECVAVDVQADEVLQVHLWLERERPDGHCTEQLEVFRPPLPAAS